MDLNKNAGPMAIGTGAVKIAVAGPLYRTEPFSSTEIDAPEYAAAKLTTRFRLRIETARVVARLSGLGGAVA